MVGVKKVGHGGTLDPLARGVLVIGIGKGTKQLSHHFGKEKEYVATIMLGLRSSTDDEEGVKTFHPNPAIPTQRAISKTLRSFVGEIKQVPPLFSAIKIKGKRAYARARAGEIFHLKPRKVWLKKIELIDYHWPVMKIRVVTGPGVYIRSLARDIGEQLHCGGYVTDLVRIRVGEFTLHDAVVIDV